MKNEESVTALKVQNQFKQRADFKIRTNISSVSFCYRPRIKTRPPDRTGRNFHDVPCATAEAS